MMVMWKVFFFNQSGQSPKIIRAKGVGLERTDSQTVGEFPRRRKGRYYQTTTPETWFWILISHSLRTCLNSTHASECSPVTCDITWYTVSSNQLTPGPAGPLFCSVVLSDSTFCSHNTFLNLTKTLEMLSSRLLQEMVERSYLRVEDLQYVGDRCQCTSVPHQQPNLKPTYSKYSIALIYYTNTVTDS